MSTEPQRTCPNCGNQLSGAMEFCPVCILREGLADRVESAESSASEDTVKQTTPKEVVQRFEHYELVTGADGKPVELGRGAMGITYKAFDIDLHCPVTLKVINERYLGNESARLRFLREARAAASLRHPNVASVFRLGRTDDNYFYAMEFVEGETLDSFIKRSGPLEVPLALEIVSQVASALDAAYKQHIVHRDIKSSNLMLVFDEDRSVTVKVIDFGLAKAMSSSQSDPAISTPGDFIGTPDFASPEQCAGRETDVRSDLYSLGITLWQMLTGDVPFEGSAVEVMNQHLHVALPLSRLKSIARPVAALVKSLLEKDPSSRPQNPRELQTLLRAVRSALTAEPRLDSPGVQKAAKLDRSLKVRDRRQFFAVAVLPFENLGQDKEDEYLSDGLTGEVIFQLSKVSDLQVISRGSVMRYKTGPGGDRPSIPEIAAKLKVTHILESSVQRVENRLKILTILYDVRANQRLWGEAYNEEMNDIFRMQSNLAQRIAAALRVRLSSKERTNIERKPTRDLSAYDLYLRASALFEHYNKKDNDKAIEYFRRAIDKDPKFVLALAGLADAYIERSDRYHGEHFWPDTAIELCQRAVMFDPEQVRAYTVLARGFQSRGLVEHMHEPVRKALELAPNDHYANRMQAALLANSGRIEEAYPFLRKCFAIDPYDGWAPVELAGFCGLFGAPDLATTWMRRAIDSEDDPKKCEMLEQELLVLRGEYDSALKGLQRLPAELKTHYYSASELVFICSMRAGDWSTVIQMADSYLQRRSDHAFAVLSKALALQKSGCNAETQRMALDGVAIAENRLLRTQDLVGSHWRMAFGCRLLGRNEEAYQHLHFFPVGNYLLPLFGRSDPWLDIFMADAEFQGILAEMDLNDELVRARMQVTEQDYNHGGS
jgi:serine/threonine protein kinase/Tfp pilus assembly protein PilF